MSHIRNVSVARSAEESPAPAFSTSVPLSDLLADLYNATVQFIYRKKFEPIDEIS